MTDPAHDTVLLDLVDRRAALLKIQIAGVEKVNDETVLCYPHLFCVLEFSLVRLSQEIAKRLTQ